MVNEINQLKLLTWKNYLLLRRNIFPLCLQIGLPLLMCYTIVTIRAMEGVVKQKTKIYKPFRPRPGSICSDETSISFAYSPTNSILENILKNVCNNTNQVTNITIKSYKNSSELNAGIRKNTFSLVVQMDDTLLEVNDIKKFPDKIEFNLRFPSQDYKRDIKEDWFTELLYPVLEESPRSVDAFDGGDPGYRTRGFLYLQQVITYGLINSGAVKNEPNPDIFIVRFPYPSWKKDMFFSVPINYMIMSMMLLLCFGINFSYLVKDILIEKEKQIKEWINIMGVCYWINWMAWFIRNIIVCLIISIIIFVMFKETIKNVPVLTHTDSLVFFCFLFVYSCSHTFFGFLLSTFFSKPNVGSIIAYLIYFVVWSIANRIEKYKSSILSSFFVPSGLHFGIKIFFTLEQKKEGAQWSNLFTSISTKDSLTSLGVLIIILIFDTFLYFILTLYIEKVMPGEFGMAQPWNFPFTHNFWFGDSNVQNEPDKKQPIDKNDKIEEFTENLPIGIKTKNLSKTYNSNEVVKNFNLEMYEGHITVLLGHNGAGKTTTMSMICGMIPPTSGTVVVCGHDIRTDLERARENFGICLQNNILYDQLTVAEHIQFFGKLKKLSNVESKQEMNDFLKVLELEKKKNALSKTLSGGMKRKLCVAIALSGKSKVVMLDEPTAGMDPSARRQVWELLQKEREGRTILLTTHYMDEADLLGDRIAIMRQGELQCCGSSFFLKKTYASGYYLVLDITPKCQPNAVTDRLRGYIPGLKLHSHSGSELTYLLPEKDSKKFELLFRYLETNKATFGVESFGVSLATLEEIFMKVGADTKFEETKSNNNKRNESKEKVIQYLEGFSLLGNQIVAMILKKKLSNIRAWAIFLGQLLIPFWTSFLTLNVAGSITFPPLNLSLDSYKNPITLIENGSTMADTYRKVLEGYQVTTVNNISTTILNLTSSSPLTVSHHYIVGASFYKTAALAWFNGDPYHSAPLSLSLVLNTIYKEKLGLEKSITFINNPLPLTPDAEMKVLKKSPEMDTTRLFLAVGLTYSVCFYIIFYIKERSSKCKHLQLISGVNAVIFWLIAFFCDFLLYLAIIVFVLTGFTTFGQFDPKTSTQMGLLILILVLFAMCALPMIYLLSHLFQNSSTGFNVIAPTAFTAAFVLIMVIPQLKASDIWWIPTFEKILLGFPVYMLSTGISDATEMSFIREACLNQGLSKEQACELNKVCCNTDYFSFERPGLGLLIMVALSESLILFVILIFNELGFFYFILGAIFGSKKPSKRTTLEADVMEEATKIQNTPIDELKSNYAVVLYDLTKYYCNFLAVDGLCLAIKRNECFGLLGVNGAGKTSTFKMMTSDAMISYGQAWVFGLNIKTQQKQMHKLIGYCPQFDALLDYLTVKETLLIFALIRGVPYSKCIPLAEKLAAEYDFSRHINKQIKQLSGGNKRKLNTVLALIGDPPVIYLDEPTAGMDPATKRFIWDGLTKLRDQGKCIILTSHSMEECEALCTRVGIMVNGQFQCLGSIQRLKNKFAQGYALTIKVKKSASKENLESIITAINNFIQKHFPGSELKERYQEQVTYHLVNSQNLPLSRMFGLLEEAKAQLNIEDYSLGQCSLEQVFLSFTKYQH